MKKLVALLTWIWCLTGMAVVFPHAPIHPLSPQEAQREKEINFRASSIRPFRAPYSAVRPFAEYEEAAYLLLDDDFSFGSEAAKEGLLEKLPANVEAVILTEDANSVASDTSFFSHFLSPSRLKVVYLNGGGAFWARDTLPLPVYYRQGNSLALELVETHHRQGASIAPQISAFFHLPLENSPYAYPGGNFLADRRGNCFHVQDDLPSQDLQSLYGCRTFTELPFQSGIGHVDERVKFLSDSIAFTDEPSYQALLQQSGYDVHLLPHPTGHPYGTYINSLLINGTLYLPTYGVDTDQKAIQAYEAQGLRVIPLPSSTLSDEGYGSIHCITMTYPSTARRDLSHWLHENL